MDILLNLDVYKTFLESRSKFPKSDLERAIVSLIENKNNYFIISKALIEKIEESVKGNQNLEAFIQPFLSHIIDTQCINIPAEKGCTKNVDIVKSMDDNYQQSGVKKSDLYFNISIAVSDSLNNKNSIIISKIKKPNFHWVFFNLACYHPLPITIRHSDFSSNLEVEQVFNMLLHSLQNPSFVDIYDKQVNLDHNLFNGIKSGLQVNYYTCYGRGFGDDLEKTQDLKSFFRRVRVLKAKAKYIHERKIVIKSLLIECDDDFWNLTIDRPNWKVDITYCKSQVMKISEKQRYFNPCKHMKV